MCGRGRARGHLENRNASRRQLHVSTATCGDLLVPDRGQQSACECVPSSLQFQPMFCSSRSRNGRRLPTRLRAAVSALPQAEMCFALSASLLYPAAGWLSAKGRVPYTVLSLMDVVREFGSQVRLGLDL